MGDCDLLGFPRMQEKLFRNFRLSLPFWITLLCAQAKRAAALEEMAETYANDTEIGMENLKHKSII